tara:strand:- start:1324 stop:3318 length:1995 start_codon:yes stop_codon:yes gene_type:complete
MGKINLEALTRDLNTYKGNAGVRAATTRDITLEHDAVQKELDRIDRREIASNELEAQKQQIQNDYDIKNRQLLISEGMQELNKEALRLNNTLIDKLTEHQVKKAKLENDFLEEQKNLIPKEFELKEKLADHGMAQDMANRLMAIEFKNKDHAFARQMLSAEHFNKLDLMDEEQWLYLDRLAEEYGYKDIQSKEEFARDVFKLQMGYSNEKDILKLKYDYENTLAVNKLQKEHDLEKAVLSGQESAFFSSDDFFESQGAYFQSMSDKAIKNGWVLSGDFGSPEYVASFNEHQRAYVSGKNWSRNVISSSPESSLMNIPLERLKDLSHEEILNLYDDSFQYLTDGDISNASKWVNNIIFDGSMDANDASKLRTMGILQPGENWDLTELSADQKTKLMTRWDTFKSGIREGEKYTNQGELQKLETELNTLKDKAWQQLEDDPEYQFHLGNIGGTSTAIENAFIKSDLFQSEDGQVTTKINPDINQWLADNELYVTMDLIQNMRNKQLSDIYIPKAIRDEVMIAGLQGEMDRLKASVEKDEESDRNKTAILAMQGHILTAFNSQVAKQRMESTYDELIAGSYNADYTLEARERQDYSDQFSKLGAFRVQEELIQSNVALALSNNGNLTPEMENAIFTKIKAAQESGHIGKYIDVKVIFDEMKKRIDQR